MTAGAILSRYAEAAAQLPALEHFLTLGTRLCWALGLTTRYAGVAAACGGDWAGAEACFEAALAEASELPHRTEEVEVRIWYAWAHRLCGKAGKVEMLIDEALDKARKLQMRAYADQLLKVLGFNEKG